MKIARRGRGTSHGRLVAVCVLAVFAALPAAANAATRTWDGGGSGGQWSTPQNWEGDVAPVNGDDVVLKTTAGSNPTDYDLAAGIRLASVTFVDSPNAAFMVIAGAPIPLAATGEIVNERDVAGDVVLSSGVDLAGGGSITQTGAESLNVHGVSGTGPLQLAADSTADLALRETSDYTGPTDITGTGVVTIERDGGIPTDSAVTVDGTAVFLGILTPTVDVGSLAGSGTVVGVDLNLRVGGNDDSTTFSGSIEDGGFPAALTKEGAGTFTLSGDNTYTGATSLTGGTLRAGAANTFAPSSAHSVAAGGTLDLNHFNQTIGSLAGAGAVQLGSATLATGGNDADTTYAGVVSGAGALTKQGSGRLTLSGTNTYSGGTTVNSGTLEGTTTSLQGNIVDNATVEFDQPGSGTHTGAISGAGTLRKSGFGLITLAGSNSYTGGTVLAGGGLQVVSDSSIGTGGVTLTGDATLGASGDGIALDNPIALGSNTLTVDTQNHTLNHDGQISGGGALAKTGVGELHLTGANTYSGGTTVGNGFLRGTTMSLQGDIANSGSVTFDQAANGSYGGAISGTGGLIKAGTGTVTLSGVNTYTGITMIEAGGTLAVTGSIASATQVTALGTLAGTGTTGSILVDENATLAPGTSVGTLTAGGNTTLDSGSVFDVEIDGSGADRLDVTGAVDLDGANLDLSLLGGYTHTGATYTVIDNDGGDAVTGTFAGLPQGALVTEDGNRFRISYVGGDGNDVTLRALVSPQLATNASPNVELGGQVRDTATLSGGASPSGQITFRLYGPGDSNCSGAPVFTDTKAVSGNGSYQSASFTPTEAGTYRWTASYEGDANNDAVASACNDPSQSVTVAAEPVPPAPEITITGVERDRRAGTATLTVAANRAGNLSVARTKKVKGLGPITLTEPGSAELEVVPRNRAARKLARIGRLKVNPRILLATDAFKTGIRHEFDLRRR